MNRIITLILVMGLYLFSFIPCTEAQTLPTFSFDPACISPDEGTSFSIDVQVENFQNLIGFQYLVTFDESVVLPQTVSPMSNVVSFTMTHPELILVQGSYVAGQGLRVSWNSLDGLPKTIAGTAIAFQIPFDVIGATGEVSLLDIDCVNFNCEIIGVDGTTGQTAILSNDIIHVDGLVDVGGASDCMPPDIVDPPMDGPLTVTATNPGGPTGSVLCMDISVENFDDQVGVQYTMNWDPNLFTYNGVQNTNLPDLSSGNFGTSQINDGILTFSWNHLTNPGEGISVPDGTVIYQVCFNVIGAGGSVSDFTFNGTPTFIEETTEGMPPTDEITFTNGTLNVTGDGGGVNSVTIIANDGVGDVGTNVCIPVTAESFDDIVGIQYSMNWDPSILEFTGTQNYNSNLLALGASSFNNSAPGELRVTWNHPANTPTTLPDGTTLYEICFDLVGSAGQIGTVSFSDMPLDIEIIDSTGPNGLLNDNPGDITISNSGGFNVEVQDVNACPDDGNTICVPFVVSGFDQVLGTQWTIEYDTNVLSYNNMVQNVPPTVIALLGASFNENNPGFLRFSWNDPIGAGVTLPDNSTFYELCFDVIGDLGEDSSIAITGSETVIEVVAFVDGVAMTIPVGVGDPGSVTVTCDDAEITIDEDATIITDANCGNDGAIDVVFSGGTAPFTFAWTPSGDTEDLTDLTPGDYTITITDANNQMASATFTVGGIDPIGIETAVTNETASQVGDGTITLTITNGTAPYSYEWSPSGATTQNLTDLSPDTYTVTVTDANNCTATASATVSTAITIGDPTPPGGPNGSSIVTSVDCNGDATGGIDLVFTGGTAPFMFSWDNGANTEDIFGLSAGTYCVTITDDNGNTASSCFDVTEPDPIVITLDEINNTSAEGVQDGSIFISVSGGTPRPAPAAAPYFYIWDVPPALGTVTNEDLINQPAANNHGVLVIDENGCEQTAGPFVIENGTPLFTIDSDNTTVINSTCFGDCNGSILLALLNGQAPFTFQWSNNANGQTGQSITNLCAGSYSVTATDATNAVATSTFIVSQPAEIVITGDITGTSAIGATDGAIDITVTGGSGAYAYAWNGNGVNTSSEDLINLAAGSYTVTVTDNTNCSNTATFQVTPPIEPLDVNMDDSVITDAQCFGDNTGAIDVVVEGGLQPYSYQWSNNANGAITQNLTNIFAGTYTVTVTDDLGTTTTQSFTVSQGTEIQITCNIIQETPSGGDGGVNVSVTGGMPGYTFEWFNANTPISTSQNISNQFAGNYQVIVTDSEGCTNSETCTITRVFGASAPVITNVDCFGEETGAIDISTFGGTPPYTWNWQNENGLGVGNTEDLNGLSSGTYSLTITDNAGAQFTDTYTVSEVASAALGLTAVITNAIAPDLGSIDITVTGGTAPYSYSWSNGFLGQDPMNLDQGCYTVTVTDANECTFNSEEFCVEFQAAAINAAATMTTQPACNGDNNGTVTISIGGGNPSYTINWATAVQPITIAQAAPTTQLVMNLEAGMYEFTITDSNGQSEVVSVEVTEPEAIQIDPVITTITDCPGNGAVMLSNNTTGGVAPFNYQWSGPNGFEATTADIANLSQAGDYLLTITDANGCENTSLSPINVPVTADPINVQLEAAGSVTDIDCPQDNTGAIDISVSGGFCSYTYLWTNGATTEDITGLEADEYCVTITDESGTQEVTCFTIATSSDLAISATTITSDYNGFDVSGPGACDGSASIVTSSTNGIMSIVWCNGETGPNATNLCQGSCEIVVTDGLGCQVSTTIFLDVDPTINFGVSESVEIPCGDDCDGTITLTTIGNTGPYTVVWSQNFGNELFVTDLCPGTYGYTIVDSEGSTVINSVDIVQSELTLSFEVNPPSGPTAADGTARVQVAGGSGNYSYLWNDTGSTTTSGVSGLTSGTYTVLVVDENTGCQISASTIVSDNAAECLDYRAVITPNENGLDGLNDNFVIACLELFTSNTLEIYNRYGQLVIEYENYNNEWIGQDRFGQDLPGGAYFFVLVGTYPDTTVEQIQGHITVLRE